MSWTGFHLSWTGFHLSWTGSQVGRIGFGSIWEDILTKWLENGPYELIFGPFGTESWSRVRFWRSRRSKMASFGGFAKMRNHRIWTLGSFKPPYLSGRQNARGIPPFARGIKCQESRTLQAVGSGENKTQWFRKKNLRIRLI